MLDGFSIEQRATQIFDARTQEHVSVVLSGYAAGNSWLQVTRRLGPESTGLALARLGPTPYLRALHPDFAPSSCRRGRSCTSGVRRLP